MEVSVFQRPPRCGLGKCHPSCLQVFLNIKCFTFFLSLFALMSGMFPMYLVSQITTIEKHFGLSSKRSGMIVGAGEIGFLLTVIFVGHFLNTSHRPRVLAGCAFIMSAAATFMAIPFFVYGAPYDDNGIKSFEEKNNDMLCLRNHSQTPGCGNATDVGAVDGDHAFGMFIFAAILSGCGATGLWSVGIAYIDDNAGKKQSAFYLGIMFCLRSIAPVIGLMFGAGVSYISVDFKDRNLSRDHPSWIGAWWVGFLVIGTITFITGIPLLFYPKMLPKAKKRKLSTASMSESDPNKRRRSVVERAAEESKVLAKSFPKAVWKILKNYVFLTIALASMFDVAGGVGYTSFGPKYIESQFRVETFAANMITAGLVFSNALGMGVSGLLTARLKMKLNDIFLRAVIALSIFYTIFLGLMAFGCPEVEIAGFNLHSNTSSLLTNATCKAECNCPDGPYTPVCGSDDVTYYSPCYAGCESGSSKTTYTDCQCTGGNQTSTSGACKTDCMMIIPYAVYLIILNFLTALTVMPFVMVSIRCVDERDKSLALAIINITISLGILPSPALFGAIVDSLCLVPAHGLGCSDTDSGSCLVYDNEHMRYYIHSATFGIRGVCPLLYLLCWYLSRGFVFAGDEDQKDKKEKQELNVIAEEKNELPADKC